MQRNIDIRLVMDIDRNGCNSRVNDKMKELERTLEEIGRSTRIFKEQ